MKFVLPWVVLVALSAMWCGVSAQSSFTCNAGSTVVDISFNVNEDANLICFFVAAPMTGWLGIAIGDVENDSSQGGFAMSGSDFYVSTFTETMEFIEIRDMHVQPSDRFPPESDLTFECPDNVVGSANPAAFTQVEGETTVSFCRSLNSTDIKCDRAIAVGEITRFLCAHGQGADPQNFAFHGPNRGFVNVDLVGDGGNITNITSGSGSNAQPYRAWHASMMSIAFAILFPWGMFVAQHLKSESWWFPLHITMQVLGVLVASIGFALIYEGIEDQNRSEVHFTFTHARIGLTTLILMWLSPFLGLISHLMFNPDRSSVPIFPDQLHWWVGRITIILGFVTIYLGIKRLDDRYTSIIDIMYSFTILVVFYLVAYAAIAIIKMNKEEK